MWAKSLLGLLALSYSVQTSSLLHIRQDIDFELIDAAPEPLSAPNDTTSYDAATAFAAVVQDILDAQ